MESKAPLLAQHEQHHQEELQPEQKAGFLTIFGFSDKKQKWFMAGGSLASIAAGIAFPFFLLFFGQITDLFTNPDTAVDKGLDILYKFLIIGSLYWVLTFIALYCWSYSGSTQCMRLKKLYYQTLLEQEVAYFDSIDVGKLAAKVAKNISTIENAIGEKIALLISATFTSAFAILFAFIHCWELSLFLMAVLPILIYTAFLLMRSYGLRAKINNASYQKASGVAQQAFAGIRTVKYLVGQIFQAEKFKTALSNGNKRAVRYIALVSAFVAAFTLTQFGIYALGMFLGKEILKWNIDSGKYGPSDILGTFFCLVNGGAAFGQISPILKNLAQGKEAFKELLSLLHRKKTLVEPKLGHKIKKIKKICLNKLSFRYLKVDEDPQSQGNDILKNISIEFSRHKVNAIVGESGSGKSTIVQLLLRYYDCTGGNLTINGHNIKRINISKLRRKIGFVGQEPVLFSMTIEDNLRIANPKITKKEMIRALKKANAWEFVQKMQKGLQTYVGASGAQLSGGQKQRIAIARALCKNPQILILDEATSALDRKNQKQIQQTLHNLSEYNITTIVIAHRLSTIQNADTIYVLDKGNLVEEGSHQELLRKNGVYARLVHTQIQVDKKFLHEKEDQSELIEALNVYYDKRRSQAKSTEELAEIQEQEEMKSRISEQEQEVKEEAIYRKLLKLSTEHIWWVLAGGISSLINGSTVPLYSIAFGNILNLLADVTANQSEINYYCLYFLVLAMIASSTAFFYNFSFGMVGDRVVYDMRVRVFEKLLKLPMSYYDRKENTPGAISTKLSTEAYQIHNVLTGIIAVVCLNSTAIACALVIAMIHCWKIGLISVGCAPVLVMVSFIHISVVKRINRKSQRSQKFIGSLISDTVSNIRTVKSFGRSQFFMEKFQSTLEQLNKIAFQRSIKLSFFQGMRRATIVIVQGVIFFLATLMYSKGVIQEGSNAIFTAIFAILYAANTIGQNSQHVPDIAKARRSGALLFDIIESKDQEQMSLDNGGIAIDQIKGDIQFRGVSFKYPERDAIVLKNFNMKVSVGDKIGVVGESGSGKSTLIALLMRIYSPHSGQILLDGRNIKQYNLYSLRKQIGVVSQQPAMFLGTVRENIIYNREIQHEQLNRALEVACCNKFIADWEDGLDKEVGQKGSQISGGQKQRVAIARCLIRKPAIYLFDESTSALDTDTEASVFNNLKPVLSSLTSLSIAHRLSTLEDAKSIIVLQDGRTIEQGGYGQLLLKKGNFYKMAKGQ